MRVSWIFHALPEFATKVQERAAAPKPPTITVIAIRSVVLVRQLASLMLAVSSPISASAASASNALAGKVTVNVVPAPRVLFTLMLPP